MEGCGDYSDRHRQERDHDAYRIYIAESGTPLSKRTFARPGSALDDVIEQRANPSEQKRTFGSQTIVSSVK